MYPEKPREIDRQDARAAPVDEWARVDAKNRRSRSSNQVDRLSLISLVVFTVNSWAVRTGLDDPKGIWS